jgi:hypothetical protein
MTGRLPRRLGDFELRTQANVFRIKHDRHRASIVILAAYGLNNGGCCCPSSASPTIPQRGKGTVGRTTPTSCVQTLSASSRSGCFTLYGHDHRRYNRALSISAMGEVLCYAGITSISIRTIAAHGATRWCASPPTGMTTSAGFRTTSRASSASVRSLAANPSLVATCRQMSTKIPSGSTLTSYVFTRKRESGM